MSTISSLLLGGAVYELFDSGLANTLGLETLNHGTNPINYVQIRIRGGDPNHGGKKSGSTLGRAEDVTNNYFYVFKDNAFHHREFGFEYIKILNIKGLGNRFLSRVHATFSGYNFVSQNVGTTRKSLLIQRFIILIAGLSGACSTLFSPRLRFRFSEIDPERFEDDPTYFGAAYRTKQSMEPWRIGLTGTLLVGVNPRWFSRCKANSLKGLTGIVQLIAAAAIVKSYKNIFLANPGLVMTGSLLA